MPQPAVQSLVPGGLCTSSAASRRSSAAHCLGVSGSQVGSQRCQARGDAGRGLAYGAAGGRRAGHIWHRPGDGPGLHGIQGWPVAASKSYLACPGPSPALRPASPSQQGQPGYARGADDMPRPWRPALTPPYCQLLTTLRHVIFLCSPACERSGQSADSHSPELGQVFGLNGPAAR